jgi:hypothetical protein
MAKRSKVYLQLLQALVYTRDPNNDGTAPSSVKKVSRRNPLSMFAYGIGLLPLIRALKLQFQRWIRLVRG